MAECVFCRIVAGELPAFKLYEDEDYLAFLDLNPVAEGHCLVVPKKHCVNLFDFDAASSSKYLEVVRLVALRVCKSVGATDFNVVNASGRAAQQSVDHLHFHVVPRVADDGIDLWFHGRKKFSRDELETLARAVNSEP